MVKERDGVARELTQLREGQDELRERLARIETLSVRVLEAVDPEFKQESELVRRTWYHFKTADVALCYPEFKGLSARRRRENLLAQDGIVRAAGYWLRVRSDLVKKLGLREADARGRTVTIECEVARAHARGLSASGTAEKRVRQKTVKRKKRTRKR